MNTPKEFEEKPTAIKRNRLSVTASILRWLVIILFSFVLVVGLVFQAPWKVLALLAVILVTLSIIPKPVRKYVWSIFGLIVLILIVWVFMPESGSDEWRPYTYEKDIAALEAGRAVPDEENAGLIYERLVESYDPNTYSDDFVDYETDCVITCKPWRSEDYPEVADLLAQNEALINELLRASMKDKCRLDVPYSLVQYGSVLEILGPVNSWTILLIRSANNDLGHGRTEEAFGKYIAVLKIGSHFNQQPTTISLLVGLAIEQAAVAPLKEFVMSPDATAQQLEIIDGVLKRSELSWQLVWTSIIDYEVLSLKNTFLALSYEQNSKGKARISRNPVRSIQSVFEETALRVDEEPPVQIAYWQRRSLKAFCLFAWFIMPSSPEKAGRFADDAYELFYAMADREFDWQNSPRGLTWSDFKMNPGFYFKMFTSISESSWYKIHDIFLQCKAKKRGCRLMIALRKYKDTHGSWPGGLDAIKDSVSPGVLIDPANGGSFVYKLTNGDFMLYSKGKNNIDEQGRDKWTYDSFAGQDLNIADDILIWPSELSGAGG